MYQKPDRIQAPELKTIESVNYIVPEKTTLNNGIPVFLQKGGSQDIIKFEIVFKSGSYQQQKILQAFATANLLRSGTAKKKSVEINQLWDFYGATLQVDAQKDIISVGFVSLAKYFEPLLDLFFEILTMPIFPDDELEIFLKNRKQKFLVNKQKVQYLARIHFAELIFGPDHPYGKVLDEKDFENIERKDMIAFHEEYMHSGNAVCFIAGNYPENIIEQVNKIAEKFTWKKVPPKVIKSFSLHSTKTSKNKIEKEEALQSAIRIGKPIINRNHPDFHLLSVTNTLLGGYFGSRLMRNIRQDKGFTYGINSAIVNLLRGAYFFIGSQVGKQVKERAVEEVYKELNILRKQPATDSEILMLRNYLTGNFLRSFDGPFMQNERLKEILLFNQDYSWFESYIEILRKFDAKDICRTAEKYLREDDMIELTVG